MKNQHDSIHDSDKNSSKKVGIKNKLMNLQKARDNIGGTRSIAYHESGHTVMNYLLRGFHKYQIIHRNGGVSTNNFSDLLLDPLEREELLGLILAGFGAQKLLESDPHSIGHGALMMQYGIENKIILSQPDILISIYLIRRIYGKKISQEKQKEIIERLVSIIAQFFRVNPQLFKFIDRLAYLNQKKSVLDRNDINSAADYAQISSLDVVELANKFRNLNFTKIIQEA